MSNSYYGSTPGTLTVPNGISSQGIKSTGSMVLDGFSVDTALTPAIILYWCIKKLYKNILSIYDN